MRTGSFQTDTARAGKSLKQLQKDAEQTARAFKASFAGNLLADFSAQFGRAIAQMPKQIIDGLDALNDLSDATGSSVENLSALESVARKNGQTLDDVGGIIVKFNKALSDTDGKNGVSQALKAIGLNAEELKKLDPAEALRLTARALATFADDGNKARLVQELFGKSIREAGPFLKDLAEQGQLNATATTEQAKAAEQFNKHIFELRTSISEAARAIAGEWLPAINDMIRSFLKARETGESFLDAVFGNTAQQKLQRTSESISADITRAIDTIQRMQEELDRGGGTDTRLAIRIEKARERLKGLSSQALATGDALRQLANQREPLKSPFDALSGVVTRPSRSVGGGSGGGGGVKAAKPGADPDQQVKDFIEEMKRQDQALADAARAQESFFVQQQQTLAGFEQEAKAAKEAADTYGFTQEQLAQLSIEKTLASAASLELLAINTEERENGEALGQLYRDQAKALRETAKARQDLLNANIKLDTDPLTGASQAVKDYLDVVSKAGKATYDVTREAIAGIEQIGVDALQGKDIKAQAKSLVSSLIAEFYRLAVIKPLLNSILGSGGSGGSLAGLISSFGSLFGGGGTGGAAQGSTFNPNYAVGSPYIPTDRMAKLHQGERVLTRKENSEGGWGGSKVEILNYGNDQVREDPVRGGDKKLVRLIIGEVARDSRRGGATRQATREAVGPRPRRG